MKSISFEGDLDRLLFPLSLTDRIQPLGPVSGGSAKERGYDRLGLAINPFYREQVASIDLLLLALYPSRSSKRLDAVASAFTSSQPMTRNDQIVVVGQSDLLSNDYSTNGDDRSSSCFPWHLSSSHGSLFQLLAGSAIRLLRAPYRFRRGWRGPNMKLPCSCTLI